MSETSPKKGISNRRSSSSLRHIIHWVVIGAWAATTLAVWSYARESEGDRLSDLFVRETSQLTVRLRDRLGKYEDALSGAAAMIQSQSQGLTAEEWRTYVKGIDLSEEFPGARGMAVVYPLSRENLESFVEKQKEDRPDFKVHPDRDADFSYVLTYIEPIANNVEAIGLDLGFEASRVETIERARVTKVAQLSEPVALVQDESQEPGVLFLKYFIDDHGLPTANRKKVVVALPFVVPGLMKGLQKSESRLIEVKISAGTVVLYDELSELSSGVSLRERLKMQRKEKLYGRTWSFEFQSTPVLHAAASNQPTLILLAGIIIGILLFLLLQYMAHAHQQALQIADELGEEAKAQRAIAINASKMASLGLMAGGIAHEINNPLAAISANVSIMELALGRDALEPKVFNQGLEAIKSTVIRMADIVSGLRVITGSEKSGAQERVNIQKIWSLTRNFSMDRLQTKQIEIIDKLSPNLWVMANQTHLSQVFLNFLNNSIDAVGSHPHAWIRIESQDGGRFHRIRVSDSGLGIRKEYADKLFDPFFTTKGVGEGSGLGLSISAGIIASYGGRLYYDFRATHTTFVFELPKA